MSPPVRPTPSARRTPIERGRGAALTSRDRPSRPPSADRILIIRLGALGDVVRTLPAASALRSLYPGAHITWLVEPGSAGVVDAARVADETLVFPRAELVEFFRTADGLSFVRMLVRVVRQLRDRRFDLVLDFHGILKSGVLALLSGAPLRYGYGRHVAREFADRFVNRPVQLENSHISRYDRNAALVEALSSEAKFPDQPFLRASPLAVARLAARLRVSNREKSEGFVLIHPGSSPRARHKRYSPPAWGQVARQLAREGVSVWVTFGSNRDERILAEEMIRTSEGAIVSAPETRSFDDLLALLARASVLVSSDSGPLHAASLAGVPVVQLLGPTDPIHNEPWRHSPARRVYVPLPCSPCRRGCADATCMRAIPPALVVEAIRELRESGVQSETRSHERPR